MEEVAGKLALELKRWQDAEAFFRAALERDPGSGRAYFGLMQAQQKLDKQADAKETYAKFVNAWKQADEDLPEMRAAKEQAALYRVASHTK
jgi:tetratricopeptide (TPR) repeat protein